LNYKERIICEYCNTENLINREHCISCNAPLKIKNLKTEKIIEENKKENLSLHDNIPYDSIWNMPLPSMFGIMPIVIIIGIVYAITHIIQGLGNNYE
jgi:hypothetical protein